MTGSTGPLFSYFLLLFLCNPSLLSIPDAVQRCLQVFARQVQGRHSGISQDHQEEPQCIFPVPGAPRCLRQLPAVSAVLPRPGGKGCLMASGGSNLSSQQLGFFLKPALVKKKKKKQQSSAKNSFSPLDSQAPCCAPCDLMGAQMALALNGPACNS